MRIAIVGSRSRSDPETVDRFVRALPPDSVIISGGALGPDTWAAASARRYGLPLVEHIPDLSGVRGRGEATRRYYARNQKIAEDCDRLVALISHDRKGGTEDTIRRAERLGKPVTLI